jgi:aspartyl-tRNA(Asn)/glutamyl-tRNA(Gln) amidotransferase subunit C
MCYSISMKSEDIKKLADLARIDMSENEMQEIAKSFDSILAYVGQVQEVSKLNNKKDLEKTSDDYFLNNIMREDVVTNKSGEYTDKIMKQAPDTDSGFLKVKQIL